VLLLFCEEEEAEFKEQGVPHFWQFEQIESFSEMQRT
jgi:hypothetical protein